ncbi:MAG: hypothetical protein ACR2HG_04445 [Pyrinomonadaceae bacterium]
MRRYTFYLAVALLAFGIGSVFVFQYYWKTENIVSSVDIRSENNVSTRNRGSISSDIQKQDSQMLASDSPSDDKKTEFTCNNKILSAVLNDLRKDESFEEDARNFFKDKKSVDCNDILYIKENIDLNNDGIMEADVRSNSSLICGASGNCSIWIYGKHRKTYKQLLYGFGVEYKTKQNSTNGYRDILVVEHASCCSSYQTTYKFDGENYKEDKCSFIDSEKPSGKNVITCESARKEEESRINMMFPK